MYYSIAFTPNLMAINLLDIFSFISRNYRQSKRENLLNNIIGLLKKIHHANERRQYVITASGRHALDLALKNIRSYHKNVIGFIPYFTCSSVAQTFYKNNIETIIIRQQEDLSYDLKHLKAALTGFPGVTKIVVLQHTFGAYAQIKDFTKLARTQNDIIIIEDLAHTLHTSPLPQSSYAIYSFGQEKFISAEGGGLLITHSFDVIAQGENTIDLFTLQDIKRIIKLALAPIALHLYDHLSIGKGLILFLRLLKAINNTPPLDGTKNMTLLQLYLLLKQLDNYNKMVSHKLKLQQLYYNSINMLRAKNHKAAKGIKLIYNTPDIVYNTPLLRFPIYTDKRDCLVNLARQYGIQIGTWYSRGPINDTRGAMKISPKIENNQTHAWIRQHIAQLPLMPHFPIGKAKKIIEVFENCYRTQKDI